MFSASASIVAPIPPPIPDELLDELELDELLDEELDELLEELLELLEELPLEALPPPQATKAPTVRQRMLWRSRLSVLLPELAIVM